MKQSAEQERHEDMKIMMRRSWKQTDIRKKSYTESKYHNFEIAFIRQHSAAKIYENWWSGSKNTAISPSNHQLFSSCKQKQKRSCKQQQALRIKQKCSENSSFCWSCRLISVTWRIIATYSKLSWYWKSMRWTSSELWAECVTQHLIQIIYSTAF